MPAISKIRFTNIVYDNGRKRYNDKTFLFDGYNGILLMDNGAGKTVFVQTLIQAVLPRKTVAQRRIQETLQINNSIAHVAVEWILQEQPRVYAITAVSLFTDSKGKPASQEFAMEYVPSASAFGIDFLPFTVEENGKKRPATKEEMAAWCRRISSERGTNTCFFPDHEPLQTYYRYIEKRFHIIPAEWHKIAAINETEGGVEAFFENCRTTDTLVDRLLIPTVEEGLAEASQNPSTRGNGFTELFTSQRDHFKQQRRLEKHIEQMNGVINEMDAYAKVRQKTYEQEQELLRVNGRLKALYLQIDTICKQRIQTDTDLKQLNDNLTADKNRSIQELTACGVAEKQADREEKEKIYLQAEADRQRADKRCHQAKRDLQNLTLARLRREQVKAQQQEKENNDAIAELDRNSHSRDLQNQLAANAGALHFVLQNEENALETLRKAQGDDLRNHDTAMQAAKENEHILQERSRKLTAQIGQSEGRVHTLFEEQERFEAKLFPDNLNRDPVSQRRLWERQASQAKQSVQNAQDSISFYTNEANRLQDEFRDMKKAWSEHQKDIGDLSQKRAVTDNTAKNLREKLQQVPQCANMAADTMQLYRQADFFTGQIGDLVIESGDRMRRLAFKNRQAHRFTDLYGEASSFSADPVLTELIAEWSGQFTYLESGAEAFRTACRNGYGNAQELRELYPFWAVTVIVNADETALFLKKLQSKTDLLTSPIFILTDGELRSLLQEKTLPFRARQVVPSFWHHLLPEDFRDWITKLKETAATSDTELQRQQNELGELRALQRDLTVFFRENPFSDYQELTTSLRTIEEEAERLKNQMDQNQQDSEQCRENADKYRRTAYETKAKLDDLNRNLQSLEEYENLGKQHKEELTHQTELRSELEAVNRDFEKQKQDIEQLQEKIHDIRNRLNITELKRKNLTTRRYYAEVQSFPPLKTTLAYDLLAEKRDRLKARLDGIQENRGRLEEKLRQAQQDQRRLQKDIQALRQEAEEPLDETLSYPLDGQIQEDRLRTVLPGLREANKNAEQDCRMKRQSFDLATGELKNAQEDYDRRYSERISFAGDLAEVRAGLEKKQRQIEQSLTACRTETDLNQRHLTCLVETMHELDKGNGILQFTIDEVTPAILPEAWQTDDSLVLKQAAPPLLKESHQIFDRVQAQRQTNDKAQDQFIRYCEQHIVEEKRRRHIVDGIRSRRNYTGFVQWKDDISKNIRTVIQLNEKERQEALAHIEQMIGQMVLYLKDVETGLKEIAVKTRIRTGDTTKDIFMIHFTSKKESEMRAIIRGHLNSLTEQLDNPEYFDESGREDSVKIREAVNKKLSTQQLMNCVLGNHAIKVKCRKATSSDTFSERPYDWEESNKWSGGETWCKNMSLFLGCLNYLAEKHTQIRHTKHHNDRVVIADNPFGKASSDHVLEPVFFIAEQLGFQIIALTAHEEGSFIRRYFPIVYSCRFASIPGGKGKVLEPEKEIKTAFFEEHSPESLQRLEEFEEIGLF